MGELLLSATAAFGIEATVKRELAALGFKNLKAADGRVDFSGDFADIARANIRLRSADRVFLVLSEFKASDFEELFQGVKAIPWDEMLPENADFLLAGKSVKSTLHSVPACQSISEKALIERLKTKYNRQTKFPKSGSPYKVQVSILRDRATVSLDTSGAALNRRGYRTDTSRAPIKETLAHGLIELSYWRAGRALYDPFCGSGTIPIEAAMVAKNISPGVGRRFDAERWAFVPKEIWKEERAKARSEVRGCRKGLFFGTDIDEKAIELAKYNAKRAGVADIIDFRVADIKQTELPCEYGAIITNPPYAERMGTPQEVEALYKRLGDMTRDNDKWSVYVITSDEWFEKSYGRRANGKRKLFNGSIKADYYQYYGKKPKTREVK